jgi:membrane-associated phospholipid phosphatase
MTAPARWILIAGLLIAFGALASQAAGDSVLRGDVRLAHWIQGRDWPALDSLTDAANWSMRTVPFAIGALIVLVGLTLRRWWVESAVLVAASVITQLSNLMKELFESPRPTPDLIRVTEHADTFGFPGGRAGNAVLIAGALAWIAGRHFDSRAVRVVVWLAAGLWIVATGAARVRVGAHWPTDILGAWLWTIPTLLLITTIANRSLPHRADAKENFRRVAEPCDRIRPEG